ncbi:PA14 domain protein [Rubripirellula obstinata]|uniref:PA14 domain protein n=2 Tax=Rubripirellula obstinata TaxID=406547 RepID=A0A5B1CEM8_9BACT|nr:PA14 domain protein [Rubripirellula obstinata]
METGQQAVNAAPPIRQESNGVSDGITDETIRRRGAAIYARQCLACHGNNGEGNEDFYPDPLTGDATVSQLAALISETMPEEDPDACVAEDAKAVAAYVHHEFYSEAAQIRRRPPRISLARLTANQLRQSLADLYMHFGGDPWTEDGRGLTGRYFDDKNWKKEKLKIQRVDSTIDFDFADDGPGEGINASQFYINWNGSLLVMETGRYEIVVNSTCAFTLDFGNNQRRLIDNAVQSAGKEEFRETLQLTAGRCYPIKLQLFQRKRKTDQPEARISLQWTTPGGVQEIIPASHLIPNEMPATFALQSKLPPDDRSYGYKRGTAIDRSWDQSTTDAAIEFAAIATDELYPMYLQRNRKKKNDNREHLRTFLVRLVSTAFRRPLDDQMQKHFVDRHIENNENHNDAIKLVVLSTIKSPRFLYPTLDRDRSKSRQVGTRLALTLYDSLPSDKWIVKAMEANRMAKPKQITQAAWRMVGDYRCRAKTKELIYHWLDLDQIDEITKDQSLYPGFDAALVADLRQSLSAFIDEVIYSESSDFRQLLQADWMFTTPRIESFYGNAWQPVDGDDSGLQRCVSDPIEHVGVLTHPFLLSKLAYHRTSSPIHRGVFLTRHVLGRVLRPPNAAFSPLNPDLHPGLTTRQRVQLQTDERSCQVCHSKINPLGFAFEQFDASGRFRLEEKDQAVDARGSYVTRDDETIRFDGVRELGDYLAGSQDCHHAFVEAAFEHFVKQPIAAYGPNLSSELTQRFVSAEFNVQQLIVWIAEIASNPLPNPLPNQSEQFQ